MLQRRKQKQEVIMGSSSFETIPKHCSPCRCPGVRRVFSLQYNETEEENTGLCERVYHCDKEFPSLVFEPTQTIIQKTLCPVLLVPILAELLSSRWPKPRVAR